GLLSLAGAARAAEPVVIKVGTLHVGDGRTIQNGIVLIVDGKIAGVGPGVPIPSGAVVIDMPSGAITPGLIDANAQIEPVDVVTRTGPGGPTTPAPHLARTAPAAPDADDKGPGALALMYHTHLDPTSCWSC